LVQQKKKSVSFRRKKNLVRVREQKRTEIGEKNIVSMERTAADAAEPGRKAINMPCVGDFA
jgi:hypothetical protein